MSYIIYISAYGVRTSYKSLLGVYSYPYLGANCSAKTLHASRSGGSVRGQQASVMTKPRLASPRLFNDVAVQGSSTCRNMEATKYNADNCWQCNRYLAARSLQQGLAVATGSEQPGHNSGSIQISIKFPSCSRLNPRHAVYFAIGRMRSLSVCTLLCLLAATVCPGNARQLLDSKKGTLFAAIANEQADKGVTIDAHDLNALAQLSNADSPPVM